MESLGFSFEESGIPSREGIESNMDGLNNIRNMLQGCDAESFWASKSMFEGQGFIESEIKENLVLHTQFLEDSLSYANSDSARFLLSASSTINMNSMAEFDERLPSLATRTNSEELLIADLEVEKVESPRELMGGSKSGKRARMTNLRSQIPVCIVHGCNKDLSSSKEYYKRHKVCGIHSKTAVVIVNGVRQRFCQQCSRFHILAEFDNGKRSCRKRLADHNERRRKPQLETHFDKMFYGTDFCRPSLVFSTYLKCNEPIHQRSLNTELLEFGSSPAPPHPHLNKMGTHNPSKYCPSSPLSVLELSAISNSSCAPSLLSAQSESLFGHPATQYPHSFNPDISMFRGILCSSSGESDQRVLECGTPSEPRNALGANTVDLLQLSLHLQRVEHQKQCEQAIKLENDIYSNEEHLMY